MSDVRSWRESDPLGVSQYCTSGGGALASLQKRRSASRLIRAVWSLGRPRRGVAWSPSSPLSSLLMVASRVATSGATEVPGPSGAGAEEGGSGSELGGAAPPASLEGGGVNEMRQEGPPSGGGGLRRVDLRGAGAAAGVDLTGDQARPSLLGGGLRRGDQHGAKPAAALLGDTRG